MASQLEKDLYEALVLTLHARQWAPVARLAERHIMTGTLLTVCDRYALPGSHCPFDATLPISS